MLSVPVYSMKGDRTGEMEVDPAVLGGHVRHKLLKQAVVAFLDHQRQHSARTKRRSDVEGSTRKLYRQKGTGNARAGMIRTPVRRGGGRTFGKRGPRAFKALPKQMRRLARNSAILAKIKANEVVVIDDLQCPEIRTRVVASMLAAVGASRGCVLATSDMDRNVYLSGRNIPKTEIRSVDSLSAYDVLRRSRLVLSRPAMERLIAGPTAAPETAPPSSPRND